MKTLDKIDNVKNNIWNIGNNIIILKNKTLINLDNKNVLNYENDVNRCFYSNNYIYHIKKDVLIILNGDFNILNTIKQNDATGLSVFDENNYAIWFENEDGDEYFHLYKENKEEGTSDFFFGKFLNANYSYRFRTRKQKNLFKLSNLLNTHTYFEYQCEPGEEVIGDIINYKENLIFYTKEIEKELYDSKFWINVLDIKTGKTIYKILTEHYGACFDYQKGLFISIQGSNQNNEIIKKYEIVDVNNGTVEKNFFDFDQEMFAVGTAVQYINDNKLYFADNVYSYEEQKRKCPKIGSFDLTTRQISFFEELKEAEGYSVNQIIVKENRLYAKIDNDELIVLEI